jgi:hypothetical protein
VLSVEPVSPGPLPDSLALASTAPVDSPVAPLSLPPVASAELVAAALVELVLDVVVPALDSSLLPPVPASSHLRWPKPSSRQVASHEAQIAQRAERLTTAHGYDRLNPRMIAKRRSSRGPAAKTRARRLGRQVQTMRSVRRTLVNVSSFTTVGSGRFS